MDKYYGIMAQIIGENRSVKNRQKKKNIEYGVLKYNKTNKKNR